MKKTSLKVMEKIGKVAVLTASVSANTTCNWITYQPQTPQALQKLKKIK